MKFPLRLVFVGALIVSIVAYVLQVTFFTTMQERLIYGAIGVVWYLLLVRGYILGAEPRHVLPTIALSLAAALILGFVPHRLKLGSDLDFYVLATPVLHFIATLLFVSLRTRGRA